MFDSGGPETEEDKLHHRPLSGQTSSRPHGQIQKISQEGSKNTYVIILSKDYLKSESSKGHEGGSLLKYSSCSESGSGKVDKTRNYLTAADREFDSPSADIAVSRKKLLHPPEDVKLNLSNIDDDEYDSNKSASSVFLRQEFNLSDSAIEVDTSHHSLLSTGNTALSQSRSYYCEKSQMNAYVIPMPLATPQPRKVSLQQHAFKKTSPLKLNEQISKQGYSAHNSCDKTSQSTAKKIILAQNEGSCLGFHKTTYSNEAVPVMGRATSNAFHTPASQLPKTNPKAVPTFSNISPINQQHASQPLQSTFIPISPAESPEGPLTSTPVTGESHRRLQQVKQESSSHRPMYIIPSPFSRQNFDTSPFTKTQSRTDSWSPVVQTPCMNNSSGFISGGSSLETPDVSSSFDGENTRQTDGQHRPTDSVGYSEVLPDDDKIVTVCKNNGFGGIVIHVGENCKNDKIDPGLDSNSIDPSVTSSQESKTSDPVEKAGLNRSLTNIQWLKGMQLEDEKTSSHSQSHQQQNMQWMTLSSDEISAISKECGCDKRPPFSYMSMIQMALHSRDDRKMMLKEICKWIEESFPYYKTSAKPGWRNSIRHNLSLYNIFERETSKRHGSYWTIKANVEPRMKHYPREKHSSSNHSSDAHRSVPTMPSQIPIIPMYSSMGQLSAVTPQTYNNSLQLSQNTASKKKGPAHILPRPTQYSAPQAYALIPIPRVSQSFNAASPVPGQQQVLLNLPQSGQMSTCPSPVISEVSAAVASIQVSSSSPIPQENFSDPKNLQNEHFYNKPMNIVKQAWMNCQSIETASSVDSDRFTCSQNDFTSSSEIASSNEFTGNRAKSKRPRVKPGLPKPILYKKDEKKTKVCGSKKRKLQQKVRTLLNESSDEDEDGSKFISNLEKEIFSRPFKSLEAEDMEHMLTTSTPAKGLRLSTADLPSPISGFTSLRNSVLFDGSFLDTLADRKPLGFSPDVGDCKKLFHSSPSLGGNPDDFSLDFNVLPSPDKFEGSPNHNGSLSNQNLSRILCEYGLDPAMDNAEQFPNLNWSVVDQMVNSMDTT